MTLPRSLRARLRALAPDDKELGLFLEDLALAVRAETGNGYDISDSAPLRSRPAARAASRKSRVASAYAGPRPRLPPSPAPGKHDRGRLRRHLLRAGGGRHRGVGKLRQARPADAEPRSRVRTPIVFQQDAEPAKLILAKAAPFTDRLPAEGRGDLEPRSRSWRASVIAVNAAPQLIMVQAGRPLELVPCSRSGRRATCFSRAPQ